MARPAAFMFFLAILSVSSANAQTDEQVAARLTPTVHICEKAPESGGTLQQALCYKEEVARQDRILNKRWAQVLSQTSPARQISLRQSERQWIKERDNDCRGEASDYINSTAAYMFNVCMANETIRRTMFLENFH